MNRFVQLFSLLLLFVLPGRAQVTIYNYTNAAGGVYNALAANLTASNLATVGTWGSNTPCTAGGGISGLTTAPTFTTYNPNNATSPALNVNITPAAGYMIQINSIAVSMRRSSTGPAKARLAYSLDGGTTWIDNGSDYVPNNAGCGSFANYTWTLATPAYLCSGMLKVRVYYYASGATTGTCQTANLRITGAVNPIVNPTVSINANPAGPVCAGTNVTFTATPVNGGTAPVYTWYRNGSITGTNSNTYSNNTLNTTDIISCSMVSNAPCAPAAPVTSNNSSVTILQPVTLTKNDTICAGQTYTLGTQTLTSSGSYTATFTAANSCDSIVNLHLYVRPLITHTFADTICAAASYTWGGQTLTTTGTYNHTFTSYTTCDSTVTLQLFVRPAITYSFADTVCAAASYTWGGQTLTTTGTYNHTFTSYTNCDSSVTLQLFVRPAITYAFADTICAATSYTWGGQTFTGTGNYNHTFTSYTSCDSTVTLHLFVRPAITHAFADTICAGATYTWGGQTWTATGTYNHTFTSYTNCDSIVALHLFVRPVQQTATTQYTCAGIGYLFGGQTLTASGIYTHVFQDSHNCDSTVTLTLWVNAAITGTQSHAICSGTVYNWGTQALTATGIYNQTFTAANGCDSIATLTLTVNPVQHDTLHTAICYGENFVLGSQSLTQSGTYTEVFQNTTGCDSSVTVHLAVSPQAVQKVIDTFACGEVWFEGTVYTVATQLKDTFNTTGGCDSVYRTVNITPYALPVLRKIDTAGCDAVVFEGSTYNQNTTLQDTLKSASGCDSMVRTIHVYVFQSQTQQVSHEMCSGEQFRYNGQVYNAAGIYPLHYKSYTGCDSTIMLEIIVHALPAVTIQQDRPETFCISDSVVLNGTGAVNYTWTYNDQEITNDGRLEAKLYQDHNYLSVTGKDENGCSGQADIHIEALPCCDIWMPNAFSPNGDGLNDVFKPEAKGHPTEYVMQIYNRWGATVFTSYNIGKGWDGLINGQPAEVADYHYRITGKCVSGTPINRKGNCTLVR